MFIDITTLSIILSVANLMQFIAIFLSFMFFSLSRELVLSPFSILLNNIFFALGLTLLYIRIMHFLSKREKMKYLTFFGVCFLSAFIFLNLVRNDPAGQQAVFSAAVSGLSAMTALTLFRSRSRAMILPTFNSSQLVEQSQEEY